MSENTAAAAAQDEQTEFRREISLFGGVSIIGGIMIGSGIFYLGSYVLQRTGFSFGLSLLCWVLGGIVSLLGGICYAELGAMIPKAGGTTIYLNEAYHPLAGFLKGFCSWLLTGPASLSGVAVAFATMFFAGDEFSRQMLATIVLVVFTVYNCFGIKQGSILQNISMVAKLVPIFIIMGAALLMGNISPEISFTPTDAAGVPLEGGSVPISSILNMIGFATLATLWAYEGWTNLNTVSEEMKNPRRNLPLALIIAIGGIMVLYTLFNYAIYRVLPIEEIRDMISGGNRYLGTEVATRLLGAAGGWIVTTGMVISMLSSVNGMVIAFPRMYYAMAKEGHFFRSFAVLHPKYRVPVSAIIWQCVISVAFVWFHTLGQLTSLVAFGAMLFNVLIIAAVLVLRKKMPDAPRPYKVWGGAPTVYLAILINCALLLNTFLNDPVICIEGLSVQVIGAIVYWVFEMRNRREAARAAA